MPVPSKQKIAFNLAYHLSRDPKIQRLREIGDISQRDDYGRKLLDAGLVIDGDLDINGRDPFDWMTRRRDYGYEWVPSLGQSNVSPPTYAPGPPGSIPVSLDLKDYPAVSPKRTYTLQDFFRVQQWLNEVGIYTANQDRRIYMAGTGLICDPELLEFYFNGANTIRFPGACDHFGHLIRDTNLAYDSEWISTLMPDVAAVKAFIGVS